jgi:arabinose operon protein AraL
MRIVLPQRGWLFDLDGTMYRGEVLIPGASETIAALRADGRRVAFLSNKPLQTRDDYARKLTRLGIPTAGDEVINSSIVLTRHLAGLDPGAPVFVIGEPPLIAELRAHGFEVRSDHHVRWVVIAFDRTFDYAKLDTALQAVRRSNARLIATNPDRTCPTEDGEIPDCAGMIAAVEAVTSRTVEVIVGKPSPIMLEVALATLGVKADGAVMVGDRLETDILMGKRLGLATVLVLTGITASDDPRIDEVAPDLVLPSIRELLTS